jgi:hypothetical protein
MEYWNVGLRLVEPTLQPVSLRAGSGFGEKNGMMGFYRKTLILWTEILSTHYSNHPTFHYSKQHVDK